MLKVTGYRPRLSHRSAQFGPWKENKREISCFAAHVKGKQCLADAYRRIFMYTAPEDENSDHDEFHSGHIHTHTLS